MRQLIQNLVQNAMKFRKEDVPPHVEISARIEEQDGIEARIGNGEICELTVSDNGVGFDQKYADRIFGVFERLHRRGEYAGTGMGLAICRKIVDRHGGTIQAQSEPGEGTTFTIRVPVHQAEEDVE
jgi:signal transduction histidine kinase